jgi:hypothetical protein
MKLRNLILACGISALLAPVTLLAADPETKATTATTEAAAKPKHAMRCDSVSGTRIQPSPKDNCKSAITPYRSYSKEDLDRTGKTNLAEALREIDPIFQYN